VNRRSPNISKWINGKVAYIPRVLEGCIEEELDARAPQWRQVLQADVELEFHGYLQDPVTDRLADYEKLKHVVREALSTLNPREQWILECRFGLGVESGMAWTLEEIAAYLGRSVERIRQVQNRGLRKLRHPSRTKGTKAFYLYY